ncbi:MAG TPA: hypothetical protein VM597_14520 [Gemmataceae bacterium]|nr:hypothetical protein [Gemmataceae bacterium]
MTRTLRSLLLCGLSLAAVATAAAWRQETKDPPPAAGLLPVLREARPVYYKGNLHTHSLWSDGDDFPEMIADWYKTHGYQFLALTDHNVLSDGDKWADVVTAKADREEAVRKYAARFGPEWVERRDAKGKAQVRLKPLAEFRSLLEEPGRFLLVPGEELTHAYAKAPVHMNAINVRDVIPPTDGGSVAETLRVNLRAVGAQAAKAKRRMFAVVNHPNWGWGLRAEDLIAAEEMQFFEVFNGHPGVRNYGDETHAGVEKMWDIVLAVRLGKVGLPVVYGVATDDAHAYHQFGVGKTNPGRGWVMVRAPHLTAEAVVRAMEAGDFYASSGVVLDDVRKADGALALKIRPEPGVTYKTQFITTTRGAPLTAEPVRDKDGKELPVTRTYSPEVGKVVAEVDGAEPRYRFAGTELYVRAKVTSNKAHPNPYQKGDVEVAWTQPVVP